jgi:hypothetical protein
MYYDICRDESHNYRECPPTQPDEGVGQVNSINNQPPFMSNPLYEPYPEDSPEFQKWVQGRPNSRNYGNYNQNSYQNNQWDRQFQLSSRSDNQKFYQNISFPNQSSRPQLNHTRPPYIAPAITKFMQGQEKMNQVIRKQL